MQTDNYTRFDDLTFNDFRRLATEPNLSRHEKVGFPDSYREGREDAIFQDIRSKLRNVERPEKLVLEIGPGCSELPVKLAHACERNGSRLLLVDSTEMLRLLPDGPHISKFSGAFPAAMDDEFESLAGKVDAILAYSVVQYVYQEGNLWEFADRCMQLLAPSGEILFGDIPNVSMRKRFMSSDAGVQFHRSFTQDDSKPHVTFNQLEIGKIDDSVTLGILGRARAQGFHAWVLPQSPDLPMANRREDILIRRP